MSQRHIGHMVTEVTEFLFFFLFLFFLLDLVETYLVETYIY